MAKIELEVAESTPCFYCSEDMALNLSECPSCNAEVPQRITVAEFLIDFFNGHIIDARAGGLVLGRHGNDEDIPIAQCSLGSFLDLFQASISLGTREYIFISRLILTNWICDTNACTEPVPGGPTEPQFPAVRAVAPTRPFLQSFPEGPFPNAQSACCLLCNKPSAGSTQFNSDAAARAALRAGHQRHLAFECLIPHYAPSLQFARKFLTLPENGQILLSPFLDCAEFTRASVNPQTLADPAAKVAAIVDDNRHAIHNREPRLAANLAPPHAGEKIMSKDTFDPLRGFFQQCHHLEDLCRVAPSPSLQEKIHATLEQMNLITEQPAAADDRRTRAKGKRKSAKKASRKASATVEEFVSSMLRLRMRNPPGMNDGLIVPGTEFPVGTPLRVVRSAALERAPLTGTVRVIVVLVNFSDKSMTKTKQHFEQLFFSTGVISTGSVKEYFKEASGGIINLDGQVVGPFNLSNTMAHYANGDSGTGDFEPNARTMAREAAIAANPSVNYAPFDNDGNGFVDAFVIIHAGPGAEQTGNVNHIWSHKWVLAGGALNADGTKIFGYLTVPEDSLIGVCAHELGHLLFGWPDLYDTDGSSEGIGNWCLMAGGSWNNGGKTPAHPSAWCKANQAWTSVVVQTANATVSIADVKTSKKVYRLWKNGAAGSEYFLVENRQKVKFDKSLPGGGLLIWHIDESISGNSNETHPKVALEQADGLKQLEAGTNRGDGGDCFPGTTNNKNFSKSTNPNSKSYAGSDTCVAVTDIGSSAATMSAKLSVKCSILKSLAKDMTDGLKIKDIDVKPTFDKQVDKPVIDKSTGLDKNPVEGKVSDKLADGGFPGGGFTPGGTSARDAAQPFIGGELRPDLSAAALAGEEEFTGGAQPELNSPQAKRMFDTKYREA